MGAEIVLCVSKKSSVKELKLKLINWIQALDA